jgi:hypothetical protein
VAVKVEALRDSMMLQMRKDLDEAVKEAELKLRRKLDEQSRVGQRSAPADEGRAGSGLADGWGVFMWLCVKLLEDSKTGVIDDLRAQMDDLTTRVQASPGTRPPHPPHERSLHPVTHWRVPLGRRRPLVHNGPSRQRHPI